jgi:putative endopeptidase
MYPSINWVNYAKAFGWDTTCRLTIDQPEVFAYINQIAEKYSLEDWKTYLKWTFIVDNCEFIDNQYAFLWFEFFGKTFGGTKIMMPLWKRVIIQMDKLVGEDVGRLYIEKFFPASSKRLALKMVEDMRQTFKKRLLKLDWMSQPSKQIALLKLANLKVLIGYPDRWRDYQELEIKQQSYLANILSAAKFQTAYYMNKLSQPASRDEWLMSPQTVNAYNDPRRLVICFPAAILQPPFFDPNAHIAINMGGMGTVICHELTHAFDDEGCMFDENGNVRPWQTKEDRNAFSKRAQVIIDQANDFEVLPGLHIIGKLVIGESIADLGGVEIAYDMLRGKIKSKLNQLVANNLTASQLFYINHAFYHCAFIRKAKIRELVLNNEHPDEHFRVNGILANCDNFYKTFNIKPGDKLYRPPSKRAKIW